MASFRRVHPLLIACKEAQACDKIVGTFKALISCPRVVIFPPFDTETRYEDKESHLLYARIRINSNSLGDRGRINPLLDARFRTSPSLSHNATTLV